MDRLARIRELLKVTPDDSFLQHALALEHIKAGNDGDARKLFETILEKMIRAMWVRTITWANYWSAMAKRTLPLNGMKKG